MNAMMDRQLPRAHSSHRFQRSRGPTFTRANYGGGGSYGMSSSHPQMFDPFHAMPFNIAGGLRNLFTNPMMQGFGFGGGKSPYGQGQGPTGTFINQSVPMLASFLPGQQNLASTITQGANSAYGGYQSAIDNFMQQLPGFNASAAQGTAGAQEGLGYARTAAQDAFSPLQNRALYQEASRRALGPMREGAAARGMLEGGQAQAGEQSMLSDLAFKALQGDRASQSQAIQDLTGAGGAVSNAAANQAGIAGLGPQAQQALFAAYPQLAQLLTGASQLPMQGMNSVMQFLQGAQNPAYELLKMVLPQMGTESKSLNLSGYASA